MATLKEISAPTCLLQRGKIKLEKAQITLNDCLACSGCITSAESVLITQQSQEELLKILLSNEKAVQVCMIKRLVLCISCCVGISKVRMG